MAVGPYINENNVPLAQASMIRMNSKVTALTDATATTAIAAPGAGKRILLHGVAIDGTTAATTLAIKDGAAGTIKYQCQNATAATTGTFAFPGGNPIAFSVNTLVEVVGKAATTQSVILFYTIDTIGPTS